MVLNAIDVFILSLGQRLLIWARKHVEIQRRRQGSCPNRAHALSTERERDMHQLTEEITTMATSRVVRGGVEFGLCDQGKLPGGGRS